MSKSKKIQSNKWIIKKGLLINFFYLIIISIINLIKANRNSEPIYNNITLKINNTGNISIYFSRATSHTYCSWDVHIPDMVEINGIIQPNVTSKYYFNKKEIQYS